MIDSEPVEKRKLGQGWAAGGPTQTWYVRGVPTRVVTGARIQAAARGMTLAEYLTALYDLHQAVKDGTDLKRALRQWGLGSKIV